MDTAVTFAAWEAAPPAEVQQDPLWRMKVYRLAVFVSDCGVADAQRLARSPAFVGVADQLLRAAGSVGANVAEGYSRSSGRDRVRLFEYALGSARESLHWYRIAAAALGPSEFASRIDALTEIRRLLLAIIPRERTRQISA